MRILLRGVAIAIAIVAAVDPALARRMTVPLPVQVLMPPASDPGFERAAQLREQLGAALGEQIEVDGPQEAQAVVALGPVSPPRLGSAPLFALSVDGGPAVVIEEVTSAPVTLGQTAPVSTRLRATGLAGRTTTIALVRDGTTIQSIEHPWKTDDETFVAEQGFVPSRPGMHRARIAATTVGLERTTTADVAVPVRERRLRVLTYEARPSWPLAFVRRTLEEEPLFDVSSTSRTTNRSATTSPAAPTTLASLAVERFDAIVVGAPETLTAADIRSLDTFVTDRGGALVLLPDRRLAGNVSRAFGLPELDEVVLERPLTTMGPGPALLTSELLLAAAGTRTQPLATVRHAGTDRIVVSGVPRGAGRVILSGAMDAWRYRADPGANFEDFWCGLIADAAAAAPPPVAIEVEPSIARPGDELLVSVTLRPTEFDRDSDSISLPPVKGELTSGREATEMIRLWPAALPGRFEGRTRAPRAGTYAVSVSLGSASADTPLLVADDVAHGIARSSRAVTFAAAATGGAVVTNMDDLAGRLERLKPRLIEQQTYPMRSPWWIVPFAGFFCAEWALRRKGGAR